MAQNGPGPMPANSNTRNPFSGPVMSFPGYRWLSRLEELDPGLEKDLDVSVEVFLHTRGWPHQRHGGQLPPDLSGDADGEHAFIAFIFGIEVFLEIGRASCRERVCQYV